MEDGKDLLIGRPIRMIDTFLRHNQEKYLAEFARRLPSGYTRTDAGEVAVFHPLAMNTNNPSILVSAGWHGDEEGATLALMDFVSNEDSKFYAKNLNISYIPLASTSSNYMGTRGNEKGEDPNARNTSNQHFLNNDDEASIEIQGLTENMDLVMRLSTQGYYTMHEDPRNMVGGAYIYYAGDEDELPFMLTQELEQWMDVSDPSTLPYHKQGTFEELLHKQGIPQVICIETNSNIQQRIPEKVRRIAHMNCLRIYCEHIVALGVK
jgi:hypothetical protein